MLISNTDNELIAKHFDLLVLSVYFTLFYTIISPNDGILGSYSGMIVAHNNINRKQC